MINPDDISKEAINKAINKPMNMDWDRMIESVSGTQKLVLNKAPHIQAMADAVNLDLEDTAKITGRAAELAEAIIHTMKKQEELVPITMREWSMAMYILQLKTAQVGPGLMTVRMLRSQQQDMREALEMIQLLKIVTGCTIDKNSPEYMKTDVSR